MPRARRSLSDSTPGSGVEDDASKWALVSAGPDTWRLEPDATMRVPGIVYGSKALIGEIENEALAQVRNVAGLPGIVGASYAMPDVHLGYGFPIGGVGATDVAEGGVVSPGGVGFDISCGVRLLSSGLTATALGGRLGTLMDALDAVIPRGLGHGGAWRLGGTSVLEGVLREGAVAAVEAGFGRAEDLRRCEDGGALSGVALGEVSERALARGLGQVGSLGSGNHFLEVQVVTDVYDEELAAAFSLRRSQVCVMIHTGSRGLGHQVCSDHVRKMLGAMTRYGIVVGDRQLACAPVESPEGHAYLGAMAAAANYGRANRQVLTDVTRRAFRAVVGTDELALCYDVSHNLAKLERHVVDRHERLLCVHRKGATLALPPGHMELPEDLRTFGQPVFVPGSMGTASYVLTGLDPGGAFSSACHGAGRTLSRHAAVRALHHEALDEELSALGIEVRARSARGLLEEAPAAYKDVDEVVSSCERAGLARRVVRLRPIGVVKG